MVAVVVAATVVVVAAAAVVMSDVVSTADTNVETSKASARSSANCSQTQNWLTGSSQHNIHTVH